MSDNTAIVSTTIAAMMLSFATAYGKNGFPLAFRRAYSRRYCSFSAWFISHLVLDQLVVDLDLLPRRRRRPEPGHEVDVRADQRDDRAGHQQHVDGVEARQRGGAELRTTAQEVAEIGPDQRTGRGDVRGHDRRPVGALVE